MVAGVAVCEGWRRWIGGIVGFDGGCVGGELFLDLFCGSDGGRDE